MPGDSAHDNISTHPAYCPKCGKPLETFVVLTGETFLQRCNFDHASYGPCVSQKCWVCGDYTDFFEEILEGEPLPSPNLCAKCQTEHDANEKIVSEGGMHFICEDCKAMGVFPPGEYASKVRKERGLSPSDTDVGVVLTRETCPVCKRNK